MPDTENKTSVLESALSYIGLGCPVLALWGVHVDGGCRCPAGRNCKSPGKHPHGKLAPQGVHSATTDEKTISEWFSDPNVNIAIPTGKKSGLFVLDLDVSKETGEIGSLARELPPTLTAETGGGGIHLFFRYPDRELRNTARKIAPLVDTRGEGGYVVVPPSKHATGRRYRFVDPSLAAAPMPDWLIEQLTTGGAGLIAKTNSAAQFPEVIIEGARNDALASRAGFMRDRGFGENAIAAACLAENERCCRPPLAEFEVRAIAKSISRYEPTNPISVVDESPNTINEIFRTFGRFLTTAFVTSPPILHGLHPGELGMFQGLPSAGKSSIALNIAISAACGREFPPLLTLGKPRRVLYMDFENRAPFLQRDLGVMANNLSERERALVGENLTVVVDVEISEETLTLSNPTHLGFITRHCESIAPDLIIVDTLAEAFDLENENDNAEVKRVVLRPFQKLLKNTNAAGILIHHVGKMGENRDGHKIYRARGASAIAAKARLIIDLTEDASDENSIILHNAKIKGAPFPDTVLRLDRASRWFHATNSKPTPVLSPLQKIIGLVDRPMQTGKIISAADKTYGIARSTTEKALAEACLRGELVKTKKGIYAPKDYQRDTAAKAA